MCESFLRPENESIGTWGLVIVLLPAAAAAPEAAAAEHWTHSYTTRALYAAEVRVHILTLASRGTLRL